MASKERFPKIGDAGRASGALLESDGSFHHLDVPVSPFLDAFVEIHEQFAESAKRWILPIHPIEFGMERLAGFRRLLDRSGRRLGGDRDAASRQELQERGPHRRLGESTFERFPLRGSRVVVPEGGGTLVSGRRDIFAFLYTRWTFLHT